MISSGLDYTGKDPASECGDLLRFPVDVDLGWTLLNLAHEVTSWMERTGLAISFPGSWNDQRAQLMAEKTTTGDEGETTTGDKGETPTAG